MADAKAVGLLEGIYARVDTMTREIVRSMLPDVSVAAQDDGSVIANQWRIMNFQGSGVVVTNDSSRRRVNVNIPGGASSLTSNNVYSTTGSLRILTPSGPGFSFPSGWQNPGFDDSAWTTSVVDATDMPTPIDSPSSSWQGTGTNQTDANQQQAYRQTFTLASDLPTAATMTLWADNFILEVYVNGVAISGFSSSLDYPELGSPVELSVPLPTLNLGTTNTLAIKTENKTGGAGNRMRINFRFRTNLVASAVDTRYQLLSEKDQPDGYAGLDTDGLVDNAELADTGTPSSTTFLRGDHTWAVASTNAVTVEDIDGTPAVTATTIQFPNGTVTDQGSGVARYTPTGATALPYVCIRDEKTTGTAAGTGTTGSWQRRDLNTEHADTASIASVSSNQITLAAGTYECRARAQVYRTGRNKLRLQNITDTATLVLGDSCYTPAGSNLDACGVALLSGLFTIGGTKTIELQHWFVDAAGGFGIPFNANSQTEIYAVIEFWQRA